MEINLKNEIKLEGSIWRKDNRGIVRPNLTDFMEDNYHRYFETFFDYVKWLND